MTDEDFRAEQVAMMRTQAMLNIKQARWEVPKSIAVILAAAAILSGAIIGLSGLIHPANQTITVHLDAPVGLPK